MSGGNRMIQSRQIWVSILVLGVIALTMGSTNVDERAGKKYGHGHHKTKGKRATLTHLFGQEWLTKLVARDVHKLPKMLNMTDEQRTSYEKQAQAYQADIEPLLKQLREKAAAFQTTVKGTLTPEQQEQFKKMRKSARARMHGGRRWLHPAAVERAIHEIDVSDDAKKQKVADIAAAAQKKLKALAKEDRKKAGRDIVREMTEQIQRELTPAEFDALKKKAYEQAKDWYKHKHKHKNGKHHETK